MKWIFASFFALFIVTAVFAQITQAPPIYPPFVNQAGYNLGEVKRFVDFGAPDGTSFQVLSAESNQPVFEGIILNQQGYFTAFNPPSSSDLFVIEVAGRGRSAPFWVADHLLEKISSKLAYDFFVDVRGYEDLSAYDMTKVYGGGPSRDGGAYGLEAVFEVLFYASNPALFDNWKSEIGDHQTADLIDLILWHAEFAAKYFDYKGPVANRHGSLGYEGQPRMQYDYWNALDHLAAVCAAYHIFLKPYLPDEKYRRYRKICLDHWEQYERDKVVRYWTYSTKWVDAGFQEFNEMGNAFGQSVFSNLFMYLSEKNEPDGQADKFLLYAKKSAQDIITNWDYNNPRHMWWIRNAEHITPQALAWFLMVAPEHAPAGALEKLESWALHMKRKTNNFWKYRVHSETEWAHPKTKELGGAPALGGSMFAVSHLLQDPALRSLGWAQVDFVFGVNPVGAHLSNKSDERVKLGGYWEGVETGWPQSHPDGYGRLGLVRGTLDGSPLDSHFPVAQPLNEITGKNNGEVFGKNAYATEGWNISNRGWMATLSFVTLGSHKVNIYDAARRNEITRVKAGEFITIELTAALDQHWDKPDEGWVLIYADNRPPLKVLVVETGDHTGVFSAKLKADYPPGTAVKVAYGFMGFEQSALVTVGD